MRVSNIKYILLNYLGVIRARNKITEESKGAVVESHIGRLLAYLRHCTGNLWPARDLSYSIY